MLFLKLQINFIKGHNLYSINLYTTYHSQDEEIIKLSSQYNCPLIGGTCIEILLNYFGIQHDRKRSDNDIDFLDLNPTDTKKLIAHLKKMGFKLYNGNVADAMISYEKPGITVDILLDRNGVSRNNEIFRTHLVCNRDFLLVNECGMLFSKLNRIIDLQEGIADNPNQIYTSAAEKIEHDLRDIKLLNLIKASKKSYSEIRTLIEEFVPKIYKEDDYGNDVEVSQIRYFNLIK